MPDLIVDRADGCLWLGQRLRCAIGRGGFRADKTEGDGATPVGRFPMRYIIRRPDRGGSLIPRLPTVASLPGDGWCDDPASPAYNRHVHLPFPASTESLWREDRLYDFIVVLGHNDAPVVAGAGSAIFLHVAAPDWAPTAGCVALAPDDLVAVLSGATPDSAVMVKPG